MHELRAGVAQQNAEEAATASPPKSHERRLQLVPFMPEDVDWTPANHARLATLPAGDDGFGFKARLLGLASQEIGDVRSLESCVDGRSGVESGYGVEGWFLPWRQQESLPKRLEPPVGSINPDHDAGEDAHLASLSVVKIEERVAKGSLLPARWMCLYGKGREAPVRWLRAASNKRPDHLSQRVAL